MRLVYSLYWTPAPSFYFFPVAPTTFLTSSTRGFLCAAAHVGFCFALATRMRTSKGTRGVNAFVAEIRGGAIGMKFSQLQSVVVRLR